MATFTELGDDDLRAIAAAFGLGAVQRWRVVDAGTINSNYALATDGGRVFVRVNEGKAEADVRYEAELVAQLAAAGVPTPRPLVAAGEAFLLYDGHYISAFRWVDGGHIDVAETRAQHTRQVGAALARLHLAGQHATVPERFGIYTFDHLVERFDGFSTSNDPALSAAIADIADEIRWLQTRAGERAAATRGIIHGDLFRDNVLFDGATLVALIDFEQASTGSLAYDLAVCINDWCYRDARFEAELVTALIAGYDGVRPLPPADRAVLYTEARLAAMRFTITRITDVYLAATGAEGKDFRDYLARLHWLREAGKLPKSR